jgi:hypothetical protein
MPIKMEFVENKSWDWTELGKQLTKLTGTKSLKVKGTSVEIRQIQRGVYWYAQTRLKFAISTAIGKEKGKKGEEFLLISKVDGRIKKLNKRS